MDLDPFRNLPSSTATGAEPIGRLTNLMNLNVDTSWYLRYRGSGNPDLGNSFPQLVTIKNRPAIPLQDNYTANQIQAIANTAAFFFGTIEQGGTSLYPELSLNVTSLEVLRIVTSIGPSEAWHLAIWDDTAGEIPAVNSGDGLVFTALPLPNNVMPTPCTFLSANLPRCAVVRPTNPALAGPSALCQVPDAVGPLHWTDPWLLHDPEQAGRCRSGGDTPSLARSAASLLAGDLSRRSRWPPYQRLARRCLRLKLGRQAKHHARGGWLRAAGADLRRSQLSRS